VRAGYIEFNPKKKLFVASDTGVPQGGIISPLLSNVILHELDTYIEKRRLEFVARAVGPLKLANPAYSRISSIVSKCRKANARKELLVALRLRSRTPVYIANPDHLQIKYVRYADD
jgi:retron-type reverse transcriptase